MSQFNHMTGIAQKIKIFVSFSLLQGRTEKMVVSMSLLAIIYISFTT